MEKYLNEFIDMSCDRALVECEEYIKKEYEGNCSEGELRAMSDRLIYKRAVKDTVCVLKIMGLL